MADWENYLSTPYNKSTPEQVKRAQEFAYALMQPKDGRGSRSWGQPIADILQVIAGQHMLKKSTEADYGQRQEEGYRRAGVVEDAQGLMGRRPDAAPGPSASAAPIPVPTRSVKTEAVAPFKTEVARSGDDPSPNADHIADPDAAPEDYEKAAKSGGIKPGGFGEQVPPFKTTVETPDPANLDLNAYLKKLSGPESSGGKDLPPNKYGYRGPFALRVGENGLTKEDVTHSDPNVRQAAYVRAAINRTKENIEAFKKRSGGVMPTEEALHLMHNQGATGGMAHIVADPQQPAWITLKKATPSISDELAKRRIREQIGSGSALYKKPTDEITSGEFRQYMNDKFNGGWKTRTNTIAGQGADPRAGAMRAGGPDPNDPNNPMLKQAEGAVTPTADTKLAQNLPGVPPPVSLRHPSPNLSREELGKFLADPRTPEEAKAKVIDQINKAATPTDRPVIGGTMQERPGKPEDRAMFGSAEKDTLHLGDLAVPIKTFTDPSGKQHTFFQLPDGKLTTIEGLNDWNAKRKAGNTRIEGEASGDAAKYNEEFHSIQDMAVRSGNQIPQIKKMRALASDPRFYSGTGDERVLDVKKLLHAVGIAPGDAAPNEVFNKIVAGTTIGELSQFDKHGRVLATEFDQLKRSLANSNLTQPAIIDLLDMSEKLHKKAVGAAEEATSYAEKTNHGGLDKGWDKHLRSWAKRNQVPSEEDIAKPAGRSFSKPIDKDKDGYITTPSGRRGRIIE